MTAPSLGLTSYSEQLAAFAGMLYGMEPRHIVAGRNNDTVEIPYGAVVIRDSDAVTPSSAIANVKMPTGAGGRYFGALVMTQEHDNGPNGTLGVLGLKPDTTLNLMRRGLMYMTTEDSATEGSAAFVRFTANGGLLPGNIRSEADSGKADKCVAIIFRTTRADTGLVLVEVDFEAYDATKA